MQQFFKQLKVVLTTPAFLVVWLIPCSLFLFLSLVYTCGFIAVPSICILTSVAFCCFMIAFILARKRGPLFLPIGVTGLVATLLGSVFGLYVYDQYAVFPFFYTNSEIYHNVVPSQPSGAVADAGKLVFTSESFVDISRSVGFVTETDDTYCIAPIRDSNNNLKIEFWAIGVECCTVQGNFSCDSSADPKAKAGVVVFDNNGFFAESRKDEYQKARVKAEATFALQSVDKPTYVRWVMEDNLDLLYNEYIHRALLFLVVFNLAYLFLNGAFALIFPQCRPQDKLGDLPTY